MRGRSHIIQLDHTATNLRRTKDMLMKNANLRSIQGEWSSRMSSGMLKEVLGAIEGEGYHVER